MHEHLGLQLNGSSNVPPTPPSTQGACPSGPSSSTQPSAAGSSSVDAGGSVAPRPIHAWTSQTPAQQTASQVRQQPHQQQAALPAGSNTTQPQRHPPAQPADEIAALRARIAELESGSAHGNQLPARASIPHQALVADSTAVNCIRANLSSAKEESRKLTLPALQPGHKVSALSLREFIFPSRPHPFRIAPGAYRIRFLDICFAIPSKVEEAFKLYCYVPYMALMHAVRSKAHLRGEDSSFVFTQDGLTAKGLDRLNELSILTVDWIGAAKVAEERTLHYWGADRASALVSHHLVMLDIACTHGWSVAMHYDVQQRELAHVNHEHNLAGLDVEALTIANNKVTSSIPVVAHSNPPTK
ncbi:uncharacterized protein EDB91DRAFT_1252851 [Suillus paluster]|uniref:uncharacterized protein n=1 Tax=Suillus paluster TaxID=48578 RepID=UPI001B85C346|nr:uncharacterized protein EDB91DRAFT_1252851 [Suillus paluster]KAG1729975.1 hypothetical protein EDB91DRAFT_1252851 [Suillus paluster]